MNSIWKRVLSISVVVFIGAVTHGQPADAQTTELDRELATEMQLSNDLLAAIGIISEDIERELDEAAQACYAKYLVQRTHAGSLYKLCLEDIGSILEFLEAEIREGCKHGALPKPACTDEAINQAIAQQFIALRNECRAQFKEDLEKARNALRQCLQDSYDSVTPTQTPPTQNPSSGGLGS